MTLKGVLGPATQDEMRELYPPLYTFSQLKGFILSGYGQLSGRVPTLSAPLAGILDSLNDIRTSKYDIITGVKLSKRNTALSVRRLDIATLPKVLSLVL